MNSEQIEMINRTMSGKSLTPQQLALVKEFENYGLEEKDIIFYSDKPEPFFSYEATCALCNKLADIKDIDVQIVKSFQNTTAIRCSFTLENGASRSAVGVVNHNELIEGQSMSEHQRIALASARAIRNTLKASGINLLKAHQQMLATGEIAEPEFDKLRTSLLAEAHLIGEEAGFICRDNKSGWRNLLLKRYSVHSSAALSTDQLSDFVAFLRSCLQRAA